MHLRLVDYVLWFVGPVMQFGVLVAMYRRGLHREYPYFFNYTVLQVLSEPILFVVQRHSYTMYYWGYYVSVALSALISFAVIQEIFRDAFRPYEALRDLSTILFRWSALLVLLIGVMWYITSAQSSGVDALTNGILMVQRSVRMMQCGLVFFLVLFSEYLGISRRHVLFGIALWIRPVRICQHAIRDSAGARTICSCVNFASHQQCCLRHRSVDLAGLHSPGAVAKHRPCCHAVAGMEFRAGRCACSRRGRQPAGFNGSYRRTLALSRRANQGECSRRHPLVG